jgi:hypothetical protein
MENPTVKKSKVKKSKEENIPEVTSVTSSSDCQVRHEDIDFDKLVDWFNSTTQGVFGDIRAPLGETRKTLIRARVREFGKDAFQEVVKNAMQSAFLRGQNPRGFTASLDWLIKPSNFEKVLSGNFRNKDGYGHGTDDTRLSYKERDELAKQERLHASFQAVDAALAGYDDTLQGKTRTDGNGQMGSVALSP